MLRFRHLFVLALTAPVTLPAFGAAVAFENPTTASWGNWSRGASGSVYAHWDRFKNEPNIGAAPVLPDTTPDVGKSGLGANGAVLITGKKGSTATPAAFITGSANIYSFNDVLDFDLIVEPNAAHTALGNRPITVALQLSILGSDIDHGSVKLLGQAYSSRKVLSTGTSSAGGGAEGTGVDNEYLYLWTLTSALPVYTFDFTARDSSLSLDALAVDIGPALAGSNSGGGGLPDGSPIPTPVPGVAWLFAAAAGGLAWRRRVAQH